MSLLVASAVQAQDQPDTPAAGEPAEQPEGGEQPRGGEGEGAEGHVPEAPAGGEGTASAPPAEGAPPAGEPQAPPAELGEVPPPEGAQEQDQEQLRTVVVDAATYGIDPVVGRHVTERMRTTAADMGYEVVTRDDTVAAAQRIRMPYPPTPADLWRVTYAAQAQRGAFARVWAHGGQYVIEISVASLDGAGPFFARGTAGAQDLHAVVERLVRQAMPSPDTWTGTPSTTDQPQAPRVGAPTPEQPSETTPPRPRREEPEEEEVPIGKRWNLVLQTEGAIGTAQDGFYNHLFGARLDYRVSHEILFGAYVGYANLRGKDGRVSNMLMYLQVEDRVRISSGTDITIPLRLGIGYLPFNGPVVRLAAGVNIPLSRDLELGFDILTPTFWVLPDRTAVSLNLAAELVWRL